MFNHIAISVYFFFSFFFDVRLEKKIGNFFKWKNLDYCGVIKLILK